MLLRRMTDNVRDQNWVAVFLDFVIVVVGVFIGFEVSKSNEATRKNQQVEQLLVNLKTDLGQMQVDTDYVQSQFYLRTVELDKLLTALEQPDVHMIELEKLVAVNAIMNLDGLPRAPVSFREMMAAGRFELLKDAGLRRDVHIFSESVAFAEVSNTQLSENFWDVSSDLTPYLTFRRAPERYTTGEMLYVEAVDWPALWADEDARNALYDIYIVNVNMQSAAEVLSDSISAVSNAIDAQAR